MADPFANVQTRSRQYTCTQPIDECPAAPYVRAWPVECYVDTGEPVDLADARCPGCYSEGVPAVQVSV